MNEFFKVDKLYKQQNTSSYKLQHLNKETSRVNSNLNHTNQTKTPQIWLSYKIEKSNSPPPLPLLPKNYNIKPFTNKIFTLFTNSTWAMFFQIKSKIASSNLILPLNTACGSFKKFTLQPIHTPQNHLRKLYTWDFIRLDSLRRLFDKGY